MPSQQFESFIVGLGMRREIATALWDADIHSPQELAGMDSAQLSKVTNFPLLVNHIHPILQKYVFNITMAKDPYKKALAVVKKHAAVGSDDEEPMETHPTISADSTVSDATPFRGRPEGGTSPIGTHPSMPAKNNASSTFNNTSSTMTTSGGRMTQTHFGHTSGGLGKPNASGNSITIAGGNFVQANILGTGPVTYNNTNTVIKTSMVGGPEMDLKKRRSRFLNDYLFLNGTRIRAADLQWSDNANFWVNGIDIPSADIETYQEHMTSEDVYEVRNHGSSRALILNNITFTAPGLSTRTGAEMDCQRMEDLLTKLGFVVSRQNNKTGAEMRELLREFANSKQNMNADMVVVYIGSHGERDAHGDDTFVGTDGNRVKFSEVREMFAPTNSRLLLKKPKMFFLQFCRQDNGRTPVPPPATILHQTASVLADAVPSMDQEPKPSELAAARETRPMDILCVYATLAGSKAYRDTQDGSWFVTALVRVFAKHAHKEDLLSMLTKVNNSVSINEGMENDKVALQMSEVVNTLRKKVFFYPGLGL